MKKIALLLLLQLSLTITLNAQQDTLWVKQKEGKPYLLHKIQNGETLFILSKRYGLPPALLADLNEVNYQEGLVRGSRFKIPVGNFNYIRIESVVKSRPIYYKATEEDDLRSISHMFNVSQSTIQRWNGMQDAEVGTGQILQTGWISYDATQLPFPKNIPVPAAEQKNPAKNAGPLPVAQKVTPPPHPFTKDTIALSTNITIKDEETAANYRQVFAQQTEGMSIIEEAGAAVFYPLKMKVGKDVYYAFHNNAERGSILKILNPANNRIIYAKVIGPIPALKEYHNAIIGLSNNAMKALGATDKKMFCKLKYR